MPKPRRVLRPGAAHRHPVQFPLEHRRSVDDYTHRTAYTDQGFGDCLGAFGWRVVHEKPRFTPPHMKSRLPTAEWLVWLYLALPCPPMAGQFLVVAAKAEF